MKGTYSISTHRLLHAAVAIFGAGIILLQPAILSVDENQFLPGEMLLLVLSLAVGSLFLLAPWLQRRSGYLVLLLTELWCLAVIWFRRDGSALCCGAWHGEQQPATRRGRFFCAIKMRLRSVCPSSQGVLYLPSCAGKLVIVCFGV